MIMNDDILAIPHPFVDERAFVLAPLADIAPDYEHPQTQKSVAQMLADVVPLRGAGRALGTLRARCQHGRPCRVEPARARPQWLDRRRRDGAGRRASPCGAAAEPSKGVEALPITYCDLYDVQIPRYVRSVRTATLAGSGPGSPPAQRAGPAAPLARSAALTQPTGGPPSRGGRFSVEWRPRLWWPSGEPFRTPGRVLWSPARGFS